jgi:hypothetical protein
MGFSKTLFAAASVAAAAVRRFILKEWLELHGEGFWKDQHQEHGHPVSERRKKYISVC